MKNNINIFYIHYLLHTLLKIFRSHLRSIITPHFNWSPQPLRPLTSEKSDTLVMHLYMDRGKNNITSKPCHNI